MQNIFLLALLVLSFNSLALTNNEHWEKSQINSSRQFQSIFNQSNCRRSAQFFIGCLKALNIAFGYANPDKKLLVEFNSEAGTPEFSVRDHSKKSKEEYAKIYNDYFEKMKNESQRFDKVAVAKINFDYSMALTQIEKMPSDKKAMATGAVLNEFLKYAIDPHTYFMPTSKMTESRKNSTDMKGLGIVFTTITKNGKDFLIIKEVKEDSPASDANLVSGTIINSVNGNSKGNLAKDLIESPEITILNVKFPTGHQKSVVLEKRPIKYPVVKAKMIDGIGYIAIDHFQASNLCNDAKRFGQQLLSQGAKGLIIDLRNNPGGNVEYVKCLTSLFMESYAKIWGEREVQSNDITYYLNEKPRGPFADVHTVVLTNAGSASASEAFASYMQAYEKAIIVGETTFGKGSMQIVYPYQRNRNLSMARTIALYYGPQGVSPQLNGVSPDIEVYADFAEQKPTEMKRERDLYMFPVKEANLLRPVSAKRQGEIQDIEKCLYEREYVVKSKYSKLSPQLKMIFDNQLEKGILTVHCSLMNISLKTDINIPSHPHYNQNIK